MSDLRWSSLPTTRILFSLCLSIAFGPAQRVLIAAPIIDPQSVTLRTMKDGLRVVVRESHAVPVVALHVWVRAGSRYETPEDNGVAHIIEHLLFRGSQNKAPGQVNDEIESVGGFTNAETTKDATRFYAVVPSAHFDLALNGFADAILRPTFPQQAIESEKRIITMELMRRTANPVSVLQAMVDATSFKVHSYGLPVAGKPSALEKITPTMIRDFHRRFYVAKNMTVVVVGDITKEAAFTKVAAAFDAASSEPSPADTVPAEPPQTEIREVADARDVQQAAIMISMHAPGLGKPEDVAGMDVLITLLGEGKTSRLQKILKGDPLLVSEYQVDFLTQKDPGLFSVTCVLPAQNVDLVRSTVLKALTNLQQNPVAAPELEKAKTLLEAQYAADNETFDGQAGSMGFYEAIDSYEFALTYLDRVRAVTAEEVQRVARTYLNTAAYTIGVIRPKEPKAVAATGKP